MPGQNLVRVLTRAGKKAILKALVTVPAAAYLSGLQLKLVTAIELSAGNDEITSKEWAVGGLGSSYAAQFSTLQQTSGSGKTYCRSMAQNFAQSAGQPTQTVIGVVMYESGTPDVDIAYLEFDEPVEVDETGETVVMCVEAGFDGQSFYMLPRVLPLGS